MKIMKRKLLNYSRLFSHHMHLLSNLLNFHTVGIPKGKDRPAAKATDTNKKMSHSHFHASPHQKKHNEYSQHFLSLAGWEGLATTSFNSSIDCILLTVLFWSFQFRINCLGGIFHTKKSYTER